MAKSINLQNLVNHIANGTFEQNVCRICLTPLQDLYEDIFTTVCKETNQYCLADVLKQLCNIQICKNDSYRVCSKCFISASEAYKFYQLAVRSEEILNHCIDGLQNQINFLHLPHNYTPTESLCITLPSLELVSNCDFNISKFPFQSITASDKSAFIEVPKVKTEKEKDNLDDNLVIVMHENGEPAIFRPEQDGSLTPLNNNQKLNLLQDIPDFNENKVKRKRKRNPMEYKMCSQCPIKYRFVRKLKEHMKEEHGVDLFVCKVCQAIIEDEQDFNNHLQTHSGIHTCSICNAVFKKRENIIAHLKWHEHMKEINKIENAHVCEICGLIFQNSVHLKEHHEKRHVNKYTCFYCGKMYKGEISFEIHIKKHEMNKEIEKKIEKPKQENKKKRKYVCSTCKKDFVDERALLWHERLHKNERPYVCDVCGRGFVSLNRRNQHALCSHTAPARRCPLCPALFHLRSMVNTHIRKVHLKAHKRRNRTSKHQNVFWKTETVPIQELSVSIQNELLEMQAMQKETIDTPKWDRFKEGGFLLNGIQTDDHCIQGIQIDRRVL